MTFEQNSKYHPIFWLSFVFFAFGRVKVKLNHLTKQFTAFYAGNLYRFIQFHWNVAPTIIYWIRNKLTISFDFDITYHLVWHIQKQSNRCLCKWNQAKLFNNFYEKQIWVCKFEIIVQNIIGIGIGIERKIPIIRK